MTGSTFEQHWMKKARWLTQALIISVSLNIGLLGTFLYFVFKDKITVSIDHRPAATPVPPEQITIQKVLSAYSTLNFQELLLRLGMKEHIEQGFTKRDLALACLVAFHHFNLERALGGLAIQTRKLFFASPENQEMIELTAYPGLADYQYQAIVQYAQTEKWPLTPQGIFFEIQSKTVKDPSLIEAFYLTPHFHFIHTLFTKSGTFLKKEILIQLLTEGNWTLLNDVTQDLRKTADFTTDQRRAVLFRYLTENSKTAAAILVQTDPDFALKKLDDPQMLHLLDLLTTYIPKFFAKELLASPRNDQIQKKAAAILYVLAQESIPEPLDLSLAKHLFLGTQIHEVAAPKIEPKAKQGKNIVYTIQPGDSLWKIAHKFKVSIDALMRLNNLETERLKPGKTLQIPHKN